MWSIERLSLKWLLKFRNESECFVGGSRFVCERVSENLWNASWYDLENKKGCGENVLNLVQWCVCVFVFLDLSVCLSLCLSVSLSVCVCDRFACTRCLLCVLSVHEYHSDLHPERSQHQRHISHERGGQGKFPAPSLPLQYCYFNWEAGSMAKS